MGGGTIACAYRDFPDHFGFFLPLAGITTVKQSREKLFRHSGDQPPQQALRRITKDNPEWGTPNAAHDMNHFMARLIFCFFAEDTDIFNGKGIFTATVAQMSAKDSSNTHEVISDDLPCHELDGRIGQRRRFLAGRYVSLCERRSFLWQRGRAAFQQDCAILLFPHRQSRLDKRSTRTFSVQ
jgi:hypothetical protein